MQLSMSDTELERSPLKDKPVSGLAFPTTVAFIIATTASVAVIALPYASEKAGSFGLPLLLFGAVSAGYSATLQGSSWLILQSRYERFREHVRYPYPAIGEVACGTPGRLLVSTTMTFTMFGVSILVLDTASELIHSILMSFDVNISQCILMVLYTLVVLPFTWFGTPNDFWIGGVLGGSSLGIAALIILIQIISSRSEIHTSREVRELSFREVLASFATIVYAFGGHPSFPTIHNDMRNPKNFGWAILLAYSGTLLIYLPVTTAAQIVFGETLQANIIDAFYPGPWVLVIQIMIVLHAVCIHLICPNPIFQETEELLNIPQDFNWQRCVVRSGMFCIVLLGAETFPKFAPLMAFVGGFSLGILCFVAPPLFYLRLMKMDGDWPKITVSTTKEILLYVMICGGCGLSAISIYVAIVNFVAEDIFAFPCFINGTVPQDL